MEVTKIISQTIRSLSAAMLCMALLAPGSSLVMAQTTPQAPAPAQTTAVKIPAEQLDALVAPIALYPDPLLSQTLVASTYPLELVQLQQWLEKNKDLTKPENQKKLAEKVQKQPWDASIQAMAALPDVVKWLAGDIQWTTDLGNAFLAQQTDVMDAVQRMRAKAKDKGSLVSNEQQKVETQVVESKTVIVIEQSNPQVVYVPSYDPVYAYGAIGYPYPPIYYPPYYGTGAVIAAGAIGFGLGVAMGAAWGGGWGWGCGWGGNDVNINVNNNFNRNTNIQGGNRNNIQGGNKWQHNPSHRGGAPYGDRGTANKFGGTARGDSLSNRQSGARNQIGQSGGNLGSANRGGAGVSTRDNAPRGGGVGDRGGNTGNRPTANTRDTGNRSGGMGDRSGGSSNRGGDSIGNRSMGSGSSMSNRSSGGFGGGSGGYSGSSARSSSNRGSSSMSSSRGGYSGGGSRGGFSGGGGGRGGGGGGRRR